jgi:transmembrane sensor
LKLLTSSAFAAVAAIALAVVLTRPAAPEAHATAVAQRQTVTLADGTRIELNARTQLTVALGSAERRVRLASGEAFFQVAKDASRPFHVETPAGTVRVTGTSFNVLAESASALDVTVLEGSVAVSPAASTAFRVAPFALTASDHLSLRPGSGGIVNKLSAATLANTLAWRQGAVVFDDVPLAEALARFAHYHDRRITASPDVASLRLSARCQLDDLDGFFATLAELKPVQVTRDASGAYVVSHRSQK